jgi:hypothetical protein
MRDEQEFSTLKAALADIGWFRRGTVQQQLMRCGKSGCRRKDRRRRGTRFPPHPPEPFLEAAGSPWEPSREPEPDASGTNPVKTGPDSASRRARKVREIAALSFSAKV